MSFALVCERLPQKEANILSSVKASAERLLNHTTRFKFMTLHGSRHLNSLFEILEFMIDGGITLSKEELFLLSLSICTHDLGMVITMREKDLSDILEGKPAFADPASFENFIRDTHHELVDEYCKNHFGFLTDLGLSLIQIGQIVEISKCHRKIDLESKFGVVKYLGALLRIIDELDISANRAPSDVLLNNYDELDAISCWHWFKHNITEGWMKDNTVDYQSQNGRKKILFRIAVRPPREQSIGYWLNHVHRPLKKALQDDGVQKIIKDKFGIEIEIQPDSTLSGVSSFGKIWQEIEDRALSQNRKVILVIDDEFRKLEDLFYPIMDNFHVVPAFHAKDAMVKLSATKVDLAIVDMQIGAGGVWNENETQSYKATGINICQYIFECHKETKVGILTGTKHSIDGIKDLPVSFFLRKPVDPKALLNKVKHVLS